MKVTLYTTHCPLCKVIEGELKKHGIVYSVVSDTDEMIKLGFAKVPVLQIDDKYMDFKEAITLIREGKFNGN